MTIMTDPDWIVEGAQVAELAGDPPSVIVTLTTVDHLTPLWIVLANGSHYYRTTLRRYGSETELEQLVPADDPRVRDVLAIQILARVFADLRRIGQLERARDTAAALAILDRIERAAREAKAAVGADDIADVARVAEGTQTDEAQ